MVLVDTLSINVQNPFWGSDSDRYNQDRFKSIKQTDLLYNLYVFGFGHKK
ncbi:hypothetical protein TSTA_001070 [Talaromyces stipitatus ATCC 10500]|uniref:Uncharacterized protein n=1 Tax=Talaromyces stipitatus (strain ATCC 10500 / CBS 375.48 / QM 6759 / NRRL 1006) TaxID=441959 RepID=B8MT11_TALSN|nr:uncharacterized protein TSTA_001070 [Talaromyces stipitatus ATCC 10500]EED12035.1 hypothetical protein TSTA_001070 [Talaromyces stipitatus ATCC 10500]